MTSTSQNEWNQELPPLVIYHANCADGFSAAWVFHRVSQLTGQQFEFYPGVYQKPPPDCSGRDVYMVDFSYPPSVLWDLLHEAKTITIIDHHKSAVEAIKADSALLDEIELFQSMEMSGATLAWEYWENLFKQKGISRPLLLGHIEDRDLWKFKLPGTREISANIFSYEYTFENWDKLMAADQTELLKITAGGAAIERKHHKDIKEFLNVNTHYMVIGGHTVPVANLPYFYSSDAGHALAKSYKDGTVFAACYWDTPSGRTFSLRSCDTGLDVSSIAIAYGGGGHRNAAGFSVLPDHPLARRGEIVA